MTNSVIDDRMCPLEAFPDKEVEATIILIEELGNKFVMKYEIISTMPNNPDNIHNTSQYNIFSLRAPIKIPD